MGLARVLVLIFSVSFLFHLFVGFFFLLSFPDYLNRVSSNPSWPLTPHVVKGNLELLTLLLPPPASHAGIVGIQYIRLSCVFNLCPLDGSQRLPQSLQHPLNSSPPNPTVITFCPLIFWAVIQFSHFPSQFGQKCIFSLAL